jgi:putative ABC transport system permease protein
MSRLHRSSLARMFGWLEDARRDLGFGLRTLRRTPSFTAVAVVTLALGIGSVTVIYSVVRNVLLDPFPYPHSQRMVDVVVRDGSNRVLRGALPAPEFLDYQEQSTAFEDVLGTITESMHWMNDTGAERLSVAWMTPNGFSFLGVHPLLGRVFGPTDAAPSAPPVAVLNHRTWMTLFGGDPNVVGRSIVLNGQPRTIVGIMPPRFEWHVADLWIPGALSRSDAPNEPRSSRWFQARLRRGVTITEAETQLAVIARRRAADRPRDYPEHSRIQVITVIDWVVGRFRAVLYTLFAAVGLLLVIACCNVANMLLARATAREREMSVRLALGASRGRIVRQLLAESALLAFGGAIAGCLLAYAGIAGLARFMPRQGVPWETQLRLDEPVLFFALCAAAVATLAFGLFPALQSARRDLIAGTSGGRTGSAGRRQTRMRSSLVVAQVALSIVLLLGAGLLMRTFVNLVGADFGFDTRNLLWSPLAFPPAQSPDAAQRVRVYRQVLDRVRNSPGVISAAVSNGPGPFGGMSSAIEIPGMPVEDKREVLVKFCSEGLLDTLGLRPIAGRQLSATEVNAATKVVVVNKTLADQYFNGQDPIGRTVRLVRLASPPLSLADPTFAVIGVVPAVANQGIRERPGPQVFVPYTLHPLGGLSMLMRTAGEPMRFVNVLRHEVQSVDRQVALIEPTSLEALLRRVFYAQPRFSLIVLGMFACTGIVLVAFGVYGVLAYTVSQQGKEIAIRMALGGERSHVVGMVVRLGMQLVGTGLAIGIAASLLTNRLLINQLWNVSPHDPATFAAAVVLVLTIGACACWAPARRATRVEPMVALRHE